MKSEDELKLILKDINKLFNRNHVNAVEGVTLASSIIVHVVRQKRELKDFVLDSLNQIKYEIELY